MDKVGVLVVLGVAELEEVGDGEVPKDAVAEVVAERQTKKLPASNGGNIHCEVVVVFRDRMKQSARRRTSYLKLSPNTSDLVTLTASSSPRVTWSPK